MNPNSLSRLTSARQLFQTTPEMLRGRRSNNDAEKGSRHSRVQDAGMYSIFISYPRANGTSNKAGTCQPHRTKHNDTMPPKNSAALAPRARGVSTAKARARQAILSARVPPALRSSRGAAPLPTGASHSVTRQGKQTPNHSPACAYEPGPFGSLVLLRVAAC